MYVKLLQTQIKAADMVVPNQELSGAKSELPGGAVGVCSFHRRWGRLGLSVLVVLC